MQTFDWRNLYNSAVDELSQLRRMPRPKKTVQTALSTTQDTNSTSRKFAFTPCHILESSDNCSGLLSPNPCLSLPPDSLRILVLLLCTSRAARPSDDANLLSTSSMSRPTSPLV